MEKQGEAKVHFVDVSSAVGGLLLTLEYSDLFAARASCATMVDVVRAPLMSVLADEAAAARTGEYGDRQRAVALRGLTVVAGRGVLVGGEDRAMGLAKKYLNEGGATVRHAAISTFTRYAKGDVDKLSHLATQHLGPLLADVDVRVSTAAAKALQQVVPRGDAGAVAAVLPLLHNRAASVRRVGVTTLSEVAQRGDTTATEAVAAVGQDSDWSVRLAVARALPRLATRGDAVALACLSSLLQDLNETVRCVASGAVVHIAETPSDPFRRGVSPLHLLRRGIRRARTGETPSPPRSRPQRRLVKRNTSTPQKTRS